MTLHCFIIDRKTGKRLACIECDTLDLAIAVAKGQKEVAMVSNGKVEMFYLDGKVMDVKPLKLISALPATADGRASGEAKRIADVIYGS